MHLKSGLLQDFADTIPGHGGIMDRFDCQYLMATFVHVYLTSFIRYFHYKVLIQLQKHHFVLELFCLKEIAVN